MSSTNTTTNKFLKLAGVGPSTAGADESNPSPPPFRRMPSRRHQRRIVDGASHCESLAHPLSARCVCSFFFFFFVFSFVILADHINLPSARCQQAAFALDCPSHTHTHSRLYIKRNNARLATNLTDGPPLLVGQHTHKSQKKKKQKKEENRLSTCVLCIH